MTGSVDVVMPTVDWLCCEVGEVFVNLLMF